MRGTFLAFERSVARRRLASPRARTKERESSLAKSIRALFLGVVVLNACGLEPEPSPSLFGGDGGAVGGAAGVAGTVSVGGSETGGVAGAQDGGGGSAGQAGNPGTGGEAASDTGAACVPGEQHSCFCDSAPGEQSCQASGTFGVCKNNGTCCGDPGGWLGCQTNGCAVCAELVVAYKKYFDRHPDCYALTGCNPGYGKCSASCPPPTVDDL